MKNLTRQLLAAVMVAASVTFSGNTLADQENNDPDGQYFHHKQQLFFKPQQSVRFKEHIRTEQVDRYPEQEHNHPEQVNRYPEQEYFQQEQRQFRNCFQNR